MAPPMGLWKRALIVLLLAAVLAPVVEPVFNPPVAEAQAGVAAAVAAACANNVVCITAVTVAVVWVIASDGQPWEIQPLTDLVNSFVDNWWSGGGTGVDQMTAQYGLHPYYFVITDAMVAEWQAALIDLLNYGFTIESIAGYQSAIMRVDTVSDGSPYDVYAVIEAQTSFGSGAACLTSVLNQIRLSYPSTTPPGTSYNGYVVWELFKNDVLFQTKTYSTAVTHPANDTTTASAYGMACADVGATYLSRLTFYENHTAGRRTVEGLAAVTMKYTDSTPAVVTVDYGPTSFSVAAVTLEAPANRRVNVPYTADDLEGWDGTSDLPLASGTSGAVVADNPAAESNQGIIDSLLGLGTGVLRDIWNALNEMGGTLSDVSTGVQALPQTIVNAMTDAFVPQQSVTNRIQTSRNILSGKAPFAWIAAAAVQLPLLFSAGSECPQITIPNSIGPWVDTELIMCPPAGTASLSRSLSRIGAAALLLAWGYSIIRRLTEGS